MDSEFTWREVSEKEIKEIKKQAKEIMDSFSDKISNINLSEKEFKIKRKDSMRKEHSIEKASIDRRVFFENAQKHNNEFIFVEKKKW